MACNRQLSWLGALDSGSGAGRAYPALAALLAEQGHYSGAEEDGATFKDAASANRVRIAPGEARRSVVGTTSHTRIALMQKLNRDDVALYFKDEGSGTAPPMLFVHGWGCDHTFFAPQQAHFSHFQRTIAVDLRGHGASSAPIYDYTVEGFVDDLAHLCRELTLPKSIVVGHSMGGTIALQFVARHPEHGAVAELVGI